jgi:glycosyltransferase involved in cell wall biosynthesis
MIKMKFSIVTVTKNSEGTIERTVRSVNSQRDVEVEHVIKDAISTDQTVVLAKKNNPNISALIQSDIGIYDAMNQGYFHSTGEIIAFLNSDDYYIDDYVLCEVADCFVKNYCDFVYADIRMVSLTGKVVREWRVGNISDGILLGQQIPHPGLFIKRSVIEKIGLPFDPTYKISADLKQQLIIINQLKLRGAYLNRTVVVMETGGESTNSFTSYYIGWKESVRAYNEVFGSGGFFFVIKKVLSKLNGLKVFAQIANFGK